MQTSNNGVVAFDMQWRLKYEMIGAAPSVAEAIGTQRVKVLLVHMCLCLVGTYESMFGCMNLSVFRLIGVCICWVGTYECGFYM